MADDIDIEEHDLLDNPALRNIFPDLSILKREIFDNYEVSGDVKKEVVSLDAQFNETDGLRNSLIACDNVKKTPKEKNQATTENTNIIEESSLETLQKQETYENDISLTQFNENVTVYFSNSSNSKTKGNRIILGSRPRVKIILEDVHPYLMRSKRFCDKCLILFSDTMHLNKHEHSNRDLMKDSSKSLFTCNICNKSYFYEAELKKHNSQSHKKTNVETIISSKGISQTVNETHECDKCGCKYTLRQNLIRHIQKKHNKINNSKNKKYTRDVVNKCRRAASVTLKRPIKINDKSKLQDGVIFPKNKIKPVENSIEKKNAPKKCDVCGISCATNFIFKQHMKSHKDSSLHKEMNISSNKQKSSESSDDKDIRNKCFHCKKDFDDQQVFVEHLYDILQDQKYSKIEDKNEEDDIYDSDDLKKSRKEFIRCPKCFYYFKYMQVYVAHMIRKHKMKKVPIVKHVSYEDNCYFCGQEFEMWKQYNIHMQKVHSDKMDKHDRDLIGEELRDSSKTDLFVCKICFKTYENTSLLSQHYVLKHKLSTENSSKEFNYNVSVFDHSEEYNNSPIFPSILFKCNKCDIHFMFAKCASNHVQHMDMLINWKCPTCFRIFKKKDEILHTIQHSLNKNDLKVYELCETESNNILYNCPKCAVHFNEDVFLCHYSKCGLEIRKSSYCKVCDILIDSDSIKSHESSHKESNRKLNDFVFVETEVEPGKSVQGHHGVIKNNKAVDTDKNGKKRKNEWFYCDCCKCYIRGHQGKLNCHLEKKCDQIPKYICKHCGLLLTHKTHQESHKKIHSEGQSFVLQDAVFYDLRNGKQIAPPVPDFPKCQGCGVHFVRKNLIIQSHICTNENFVICQICDSKFTDAAYKLHITFHNYSLNNSSKIMSSDTLPSEISLSEKVIQEVSKKKLIVKVQKLNFSDTSDEQYPIYNCNRCRIAFDCYDKVVEHCQAHFVKEVYKYFPTKYCEICDLEYSDQCYEEHYKIHSLTKNDKNNIKALNFDLDFFLQDNRTWLKHVFNEFPGKERLPFIADSIYRHEARVKLTVIQDGPPNLTVYKCDNCNCFVDRGSLFKHAKNSCFNLRKHTCSVCGLPFISYISKEEHEKIHSNKQIEIKEHSYRIIVFNRAQDKIVNDAISERKKYVLHQCRNCDFVVNIQKYSDHVCERYNMTKCKECGLIFRIDDYKLHSLKHQECNDYYQRNMKVLLCGQKTHNNLSKKDTISTPNFKGVVHDYTFYQCPDCQACMKDCQSTRHDCELKYKCKDCDLFFVNKQHSKLHENDPDFVKFNINLIPLKTKSKKHEPVVEEENYGALVRKSNIEVDDSEGIPLPKIKQINIYKCACELHFFEPSSITSHLNTCNTKVKNAGQKCSKCELVFTPKTLFSHVLRHHGNKNISYKFKVIDVCKKENTLYKCCKCMLHFLTYGDAYEHIGQCKNVLTNGKQCKVCERYVALTHLREHEERHTLSMTTEIVIRQVVVNDLATDVREDSDDSSKAGSILSGCLALSKQQLARMDLSKYSNVLYKCQNCNFVALDQITLVCHLLSNVHLVKNLESCPQCEYSFPMSSLMIHVYVHHEKWKLSKSNFIIQEYDDLLL